MRRRNTIRIAMLVAVALGTFLVLNSVASTGKGKACKESLDQCCKKNPATPAKTGLGSLSQHFFSSI